MDQRTGGPGRADLAILAYVGALLVVWSPALYLGLLTPRIAVLLVGLGPGLVVVAGLVRRRDHAARWAAAYLAWALLAVVVAPHPRQAVAGTYGTDVGWIYLAGYVGAWGLGRRLGPAGRRLLPAVLLAGVGLNALFGVIEAAVEPGGDLATEAGRVHGLVSNSLFLGGLLVGALALLGNLVGAHPRRRLVLGAAIVPFAMAVNLTGSRVALVGGAALAVAGAVVAGRRREPLPLAAVGLVAGAVVVGFLLSLPLQSAESGATRLGETSTSSGYQSRAIMWRLGLEATADRPLTGWGPGRFAEATAPRTTAEFVQAEGPDKLFYDAHNLVVEHLVTTGIVGVALLGGFAVSLARRCRGPLAWFGTGIAVTWLFNPVSVSTGAVALLALGAAWVGLPGTGADPSEAGGDRADDHDPEPSAASSDRLRVAGRTIGAVLAAAGLVAGVTLLRADALLDQGVASGDVDTVRRAADLLPRDAVVTGILAEALVRVADEEPTAANRRAVVVTTQRAVDLDPTRSYWWSRLGSREFAYGSGDEEERLDRAEAAFRGALERSPWSALALFGLRGVAEERGDDAEVARLSDRLCEIDICLPADP